MIEPVPTRRVAVYLRVSSEDQRERETIKTQRIELERLLARDPFAQVIEQLEDNGVSGTIPLEDRPAGGRLISLAKAHAFDELLVYKVDRLGRDALDVMAVRRRLDALGIRLITVVDGEPDQLGFDVQAVVADHNRRKPGPRSAGSATPGSRPTRPTRWRGGTWPAASAGSSRSACAAARRPAGG